MLVYSLDNQSTTLSYHIWLLYLTKSDFILFDYKFNFPMFYYQYVYDVGCWKPM